MSRALVVVLVYNGAGYVRDCLQSLRKAFKAGTEADVLVVDNASSDDSVARVRAHFPEVRVIENPENIGFAGGNNVGLRCAIERSYEYVYLLNQDTVVDAGFLAESLEVAETDPSIAAVQSKILLHRDRRRINTIGNEIHFLGFAFSGGYGALDEGGAAQGSCVEITYASGAAVLLRVSALEQTGLFNEELFLYHEDVDLGWRQRLMGRRVVLAPRSVVYHKYEFSKGARKFYYMERNRYLVMLQNCRIATLVLLAVPAAVMQAGMVFFAAANGWLAEEFRILLYFCRPAAWRRLCEARRRVQAARRAPDRLVLRRFRGRLEFAELRSPILLYVANPLLDLCWTVLRPLIRW
jgi:hypothetical protein